MSGWWLRSKNASSTPTEIQSLQQNHGHARKFCLAEDRGRDRYLKKYFKADINDPLLYHLIINTGLVNYDEAAKLIGDAVLNLKPG